MSTGQVHGQETFTTVLHSPYLWQFDQFDGKPLLDARLEGRDLILHGIRP